MGWLRRPSANALVILPVCASFMLAACGGNEKTPTEPPEVASPSSPSTASTGSTGPDGSWPGKPKRPDPVKYGPPVALSWRVLDGAHVPELKKSAAVRTQTPTGAVLSAAQYAVAFDPRMSERVWRAVLKHATGDVAAAAQRTANDARQIEKKRAAHEHDGPQLAWGRPVTVLGYSSVTYTSTSTKATVWVREDTSDPGFYKRPVTVQWSGGRWVLDLPISGWHLSEPSESLAPIGSEPMVETSTKKTLREKQNGKNRKRHGGSDRG